jgi:hypothetical protein
MTSTARPSASSAASMRSAVMSCADPRNLARFGLRTAVGAPLAGSLAAKAEVVLDGTLGRAGALDGPEFRIRAEHGRDRRAGGSGPSPAAGPGPHAAMGCDPDPGP